MRACECVCECERARHAAPPLAVQSLAAALGPQTEALAV